MVPLLHRDRSRYIYTDSESVGAIVETPKLLEVLVEKDGGGLRGKDEVRVRDCLVSYTSIFVFRTSYTIHPLSVADGVFFPYL